MNQNVSVKIQKNAYFQSRKLTVLALIVSFFNSFLNFVTKIGHSLSSNSNNKPKACKPTNLVYAKFNFSSTKNKFLDFFTLSTPENRQDYTHEDPNYKHALYLLTKSISTGVFLLLFTAWIYNLASIRPHTLNLGVLISLIAWLVSMIVILTGFKNLHHFRNFIHRSSLSLRIKLSSYTLLIYGVFIVIYILSNWLNWESATQIFFYLTSFIAFVISISHNFLSALGHTKLFWKSYIGSVYLFNLSFLAGASTYSILGFFIDIDESWQHFSYLTMLFTLFANFFLSIIVYFINSPRIKKIHLLRGNFKYDYKNLFWIGSVVLGNIVPFIILLPGDFSQYNAIAGVFTLVGIYFMPE